jgi:hypothetical protein
MPRRHYIAETKGVIWRRIIGLRHSVIVSKIAKWFSHDNLLIRTSKPYMKLGTF